jgi:formylglycine-generating enzyme required for sulfatase activity
MEKPMKTKRPLIVILIPLVFALACGVLTVPSVSENTPLAQTQETATQPPAVESQTRSIVYTITKIIDGKGIPMVLVPEGEFTMGETAERTMAECQKYSYNLFRECGASADQEPTHQVYLDSYYIDQYEVTHALYKTCVDAGVCKLSGDTGPGSTYSTHHYGGENNYPMFDVDWEAARIYCETWRGARLPTEAEWEKSARGTDGRTYPWGEGLDISYANIGDYDIGEGAGADTTLVGSYASDKSPYGVYDMAGNVSEWINDWYDKNYYQNSPSSNPQGPDSGESRVIRGGSWSTFDTIIARSAKRGSGNPSRIDEYIGFRCALTPPVDDGFSVTQSQETIDLPEVKLYSIPTPSFASDTLDDKGIPVILIPEGEFTMGIDFNDLLELCQKDNRNDCQTANRFVDPAETPAHQVHLDAFYMDKYEVINTFYQSCVDAGVCDLPKEIGSRVRSVYYGNPDYADYPVIHVTWTMAKTYCEWRGASLPTEAQWEKAARGTDAKIYPWGKYKDSFENGTYSPIERGVVNDFLGETTIIGRFENGRSPYGVYDIAGNVEEWVADWYSETYYQNSPSSNPLGPDNGEYRVSRGGFYGSDYNGLRSSYRNAHSPDFTYQGLGFRCARTP